MYWTSVQYCYCRHCSSFVSTNNRRRKSHFCYLIKCCLLKSEHLPTPTDLSILTLLVWDSSFWTKSHTLTPDPPNLTLFSVKSHTYHSFVILSSQWLQLCWLYSYSICTFFIVNLTDFTRTYIQHCLSKWKCLPDLVINPCCLISTKICTKI